MKTKLLAMLLMAGGSMFASTRISVGIGVGSNAPAYYAQPAPVQAVIPPCPGPDYTWVDGYWAQNAGHRNWVAGSWQRRPAPVVVAPRHEAPKFDYRGYRDDRAHVRDRERDRDHGRPGDFSNGFRSR